MPQDPLDFSEYYNTPLNPQQQTGYNQFIQDFAAKNGGRNLDQDRYDYDVPGYYLSGESQKSNGHFTDKFKKPNHPTFSDESQYHGHEGNLGGHWGNGVFQVSPTNLKYRNRDQINQYFQQQEPDYKPDFGPSVIPTQSVAAPSQGQQMPSMFDFFSKKLLGKTAQDDKPVQPQGNQDAGIDVSKLAQQNANQKLANSTNAPATAPVINNPNKKKALAQ